MTSKGGNEALRSVAAGEAESQQKVSREQVRALLGPLLRLLGRKVAYVAEIADSVGDEHIASVQDVFVDSWQRSCHWSSQLEHSNCMEVDGRHLRVEIDPVRLAENSVLSETDEDGDPVEGAALRESLETQLARVLESLLARIEAPWENFGHCPVCGFDADYNGYCRLHEPAEVHWKRVYERQRSCGKLQDLLDFCASPLPPAIEEDYVGDGWAAHVVFNLTE